MPSIKHVAYKQWAGFVVRGGPPFDRPVKSDVHMHRAVWLASRVEGAAWGTVQSYDGCGISGGLLHHIAVNRDGTQGSLWRLVQRVFATAPDASATIRRMLLDRGWHLAPDASLRTGADHVVRGPLIVEEFAGPRGLCPPAGPIHDRARKWALAWHDMLAHPGTYAAQVESAISWMTGGQRDTERESYAAFLPQRQPPSDLARVRSDELPAALDLAMCVYHAFSVNAPSLAAQCLRAQRLDVDAETFARSLVRSLGSQHYGRWHDTADGANRYDATRIVAKNSGLWAPELVDAIAPRDL